MTHTHTSRRSFLQTSAAVTGGLMLGFNLPGTPGEAMAAGTVHTPNAWVHIADNNTITLLSARSEMGQGVYTSMPMLIAEELNVDLRKVKVAFAPPDAKAASKIPAPMRIGTTMSAWPRFTKLVNGSAWARKP